MDDIRIFALGLLVWIIAGVIFMTAGQIGFHCPLWITLTSGGITAAGFVYGFWEVYQIANEDEEFYNNHRQNNIITNNRGNQVSKRATANQQ